MVSSALVKLSSPFAKSCLVAIEAALIIDAVLTIFAASQYPYLIAYTNELYVSSSSPITILYAAVSAAAILMALSTAWASYKPKTNYVLIHACITAVFLPVTILVYFTSLSSRYKASDFVDDFRQMILDYRVTNQQIKQPQEAASSSSTSHSNSTHSASSNGDSKPSVRFISFSNHIDKIQTNFACCGVDSLDDWVKQWDGYIPPSCCQTKFHTNSKANERWATLFNTSHEFYYCSPDNAHQLACLNALKDDEKSKFAWLADLIVFMMVITITNTIVSLLLFGLSKTEDMPYDPTETELAMVGVSTKPRPSQPEITGIRHRPSVVTMGANKEQISSISQAIRFNLSNSPRASISGPSKFSAAARRGSAHV